MNPDLKSMTRKELEKLQASVEKALARVTENEKKAARAAAEKAAAAHGFSLAEITNSAPAKRGPKPKAGPKTISPAKYKNPSDPTQTWTGKGRQPQWFKAAIKAGTSPDNMEI